MVDQGRSEAEAAIVAWFAERLPGEWFVEAPEVSVDRDEVLVVGRLAEPEFAAGASAASRAKARAARIERFREETRERRQRIAHEAEHLFGRKVSWGAACGDLRHVFTHLSVPVMTRLRMAERLVLDTLVDASVARSRSDALAWCVRLVGRHQAEWIGQLREALVHVEKVRSGGPSA